MKSFITSGASCYVKIYISVWWPFCSAEQNRFDNFGSRSYEEHLCEII